jgi:hypothetical protein
LAGPRVALLVLLFLRVFHLDLVCCAGYMLLPHTEFVP